MNATLSPARLPYCLVAFLLLMFAAGCLPTGAGDGSSRNGNGFIVPAARAAEVAAPAKDPVVPGRLLIVKSGALLQWTDGKLKSFASDQRYDGPAYSPEGGRVAVAAVGDNHSDLVLLDGNGRRLRQLTDNWSKSRVQDSAWARRPTWSPDGARLAYVTDTAGSQMSLWVMDDRGGNRRVLLPSPGWGGVDQPSWSPQGNSIALTVFEGNNSQIYVVNAATGGLKVVTAHQDGAYDPTWSPDGTMLAYTARTEGRNDIWVVTPPDGKPVRLTDLGAARSPVWSPNGELIAFLADRGKGFDLFVIRPRFPNPGLVPSGEIKALTDGQNMDGASGVSWGR